MSTTFLEYKRHKQKCSGQKYNFSIIALFNRKEMQKFYNEMQMFCENAPLALLIACLIVIDWQFFLRFIWNVIFNMFWLDGWLFIYHIALHHDTYDMKSHKTCLKVLYAIDYWKVKIYFTYLFLWKNNPNSQLFYFAMCFRYWNACFCFGLCDSTHCHFTQ